MRLDTDTEAAHIAAIRRSMDAGFRFAHLREVDGSAVAAIYAERHRDGAVDTYTVRGMTEAVAARYRWEDYQDNGDPIWQSTGTVTEVITGLLALPRHSDPGAPSRAVRAASALWLPVC